ncbi:MAG: hypothetical protein AABY40_00490 [Nanoarchaeota archaeon]
MIKKTMFLVAGLVVVSLVLLGLNGNITGKASYITRSCIDSEKGNDPYVAGVVVARTLAMRESQEFADRCKTKKAVLEHSCDGIVRKSETINCPVGCKDGACLRVR